ncbi:MAG: Na+/H+ antiporter subunit D [Planctomycetes bacterium]|jgi:multicomponent Na+:H+ antiporter subunit D|nr:Na+/H+ antiporter subunit D [Planctomycetota bacterium]
MSLLPALPVLVPLSAAALSFAAWKRLAVQQAIGVAGTGGLLAAGVALLAKTAGGAVLVLPVGGWPARFGIALAADTLSAIMVLLAGLMGLAVAVYALADVDRPRKAFGFYPFLHLMLAGVAGSFVTADMFNMYVWFEVMLLGSFVLLALGGERDQMAGAMKYVTLNLIGSALFLSAAGVLYAVTKTLNMGEVSTRLALIAGHHPHLVLALGALFLTSFAIKAGLFPFTFWLPASYATPPVAVSAVFAGLLTKVGVYALLRTFTVVFPVMERNFRILLLLAGITMVLGVLGAVSRFEIRKILSFHIISQIGYMVAALGLSISPDPEIRRLALAGAVFYIAHHIVVKTNLFLVGGVIRRLTGSFDLKRTGGLAKSAPWLAVLFLIPALSLAGVPPLSGFWAKLMVIRAGLSAGEWLLVAAAIAAGLLTLISMVKIWNEAFWKPAPSPAPHPRPGRGTLLAMTAPIAVLALVTVLIGLWPQPLLDVAGRAADQLLDPAGWAKAVAGDLR